MLQAGEVAEAVAAAEAALGWWEGSMVASAAQKGEARSGLMQILSTLKLKVCSTYKYKR